MNTRLSINDAFTERALQIYEDAKSQIGYVAHRFRQKLLRDGGLAAAKHWLRPSKVTPGFERLLDHRRLDLSVEAVALQPPWNRLFTAAELATARDRLNQFGYGATITKNSSRPYWVVSPNVRNNEATVGAWRQASVRVGAAFMGWYPDNWDHGQMGPKFAGKSRRGVSPGDILLIARRHRFKPEIVGFGVVRGDFAKHIAGFKPPETFGSLRRLRPFVPWSGKPPNHVPINEVVRHTKALVQLHPESNIAHRRVCDWIDQQLQKRSSPNSGNSRTDSKIRRETSATAVRIVSSPENHQLDYRVQTRAKVIKAKKIEAALLEGYRRWLRRQDRELLAVRYRTLQCDAFERNRRNLIEAKSSVSREHIRMAVGQLLDYAFHGRKKLGHLHKAILLPREPPSDIADWLDSLEIKIIWRERRTFLDNANGQFT